MDPRPWPRRSRSAGALSACRDPVTPYQLLAAHNKQCNGGYTGDQAGERPLAGQFHRQHAHLARDGRDLSACTRAAQLTVNEGFDFGSRPSSGRRTSRSRPTATPRSAPTAMAGTGFGWRYYLRRPWLGRSVLGPDPMDPMAAPGRRRFRPADRPKVRNLVRDRHAPRREAQRQPSRVRRPPGAGEPGREDRSAGDPDDPLERFEDFGESGGSPKSA